MGNVRITKFFRQSHRFLRCQQRFLLIPLSLSLGYALNIATDIRAQQAKPNEYEVKAAYLYNFGKFVNWPSKGVDGGFFPICVLGADPFGRALDSTLVNQTINGRGVVAKRISKPQDALNCRIVFIGSSESKELKDVLVAFDKAAVLTVSDAPDFCQRGGMIQFVMERDKVRFEVNLANAERAGLSLSSELLKVAVVVR